MLAGRCWLFDGRKEQKAVVTQFAIMVYPSCAGKGIASCQLTDGCSEQSSQGSTAQDWHWAGDGMKKPVSCQLFKTLSCPEMVNRLASPTD